MIVNLTKAEKNEIGTDADCVMVECKTADPRTNLTEPKQEHVYQTHVQMGIVRQSTDYRPTHSILSYTDASFWSEGKEFDDRIRRRHLHRSAEPRRGNHDRHRPGAHAARGLDRRRQ